MKVKLKRLSPDKYGDSRWGWNDLVIVRRKWVLPYACISYEVFRDGEVVESGFDTLREVREVIAQDYNGKEA